MKSGLEIHQRLKTHKLFCNCPSIDVGDKKPSRIIRRKQYAVKSEFREEDLAARFEQEKDKLYSYYYYDEACCEVEADESPPLRLNMEALKIAFAIALKLNATPVDEIQVMRKQVTDGSNTAGFQRTMLIATDGYLETSKGRVGIDTVCLEEESAGIVRQGSDKVIYRLDRLGIPLVEVTTSPEIKDAEHAREVAEKVGLLMRLTGKVMRGIGTIRQDINVSVEGGARVEIKGAQQLEMIPKIINNEVQRQKNLKKLLIKLKSYFQEKRGRFDFDMKYADVTEIFKETGCELIKKGIKKNGRVLVMKLPNHSGILGYELLPGRRYGTELRDYARIAGVKGIIHSDEDLDRYGIDEDLVRLIHIILEMGEKDAFILVVGPKNKVWKALELVYYRATMSQIPEETRKVIKDEFTSFMRPISGRSRMYPETDIAPIRVTPEMLRGAKRYSGPSIEEIKSLLKSQLNEELAIRMLRSKNLQLYLNIMNKTNENDVKVEPKLVAVTLEETVRSLSRQGFGIDQLNDEFFYELFKLYSKGIFVKSAVPEIIKIYLNELQTKSHVDLKKLIENNNLVKLSEKEVKKIFKEYNGDIKKIMSRYRLVIDPEILKRLMKTKQPCKNSEKIDKNLEK